MMVIKGSIKAKLLEQLDGLAAMLPPNKRGDNLSPMLGDVYVAQEAKKWAEDKLKKSWTAAQESGAVPTDEVMRGYGKGQHIVCESTNFSVVAKVDTPRANFDKEAFMEQVSKRYKVPLDRLKAIADACVAKSAPPLTKRVDTAPGV